MKPTAEKILTLDKLVNLKIKHKGKKIGLCSGCFDIFHSGHVVFFEQCKELCDILVVSVGSDSVIKKLKGNGRPINFQNNRVFLVGAIGNVDYSIMGSEAEEMKEGKIDFYEILKNLKPDIFILNDDDSAMKEKQELCKEFGTQMKTVKRFVPEFLNNVSSTKIINQIKGNKV